MKNPYLYKSSLVIKIALGTSILLIVYFTFTFFNQMQNLGSSVDSMSASTRRLAELQRVLSVVAINESSVRSFIITGDSTYLTKRFNDRSVLEPQLRKLSKFKSKRFHYDSLETLINRRYALFDEVLSLYKNSPEKKKSLAYVMAVSDTVTDRIEAYVAHSLESESSIVEHSAINHSYEIRTSIITSFLLVVIALFIILVSLVRISSDLRDMKKQSDELKFLNYTFNNAEKIAGISHWKYNVRARSYTFSDNFYNLIGVNPETFEPSIENVVPYLHPDDRDSVVAAYTDSLINKKPTSLIFRIYRKTGEMRYIKSVSSFTENSQGDLVKIGVNYDITDQYQNTASLEENNRHLRQVNAELESFNNIVSHDLQEPMRKIQMFVSRIDENEYESLTTTGRDYFERIRALANRMQTLMIDLINYSRAVKGDKAFVKTDLKAVIDEVKNELALNIEEAGAKIMVGDLPSAYVIPFQIQQLFVNLVSNSLKFAREGAVPDIEISREKIAEGQRHGDLAFSDKDYYRIVVADKGIGFKQEFAEKIFQLFRRLDKDAYRGTGIGLAICKRVVENHDGYIFAEGNEGTGARFIIYLPKRKPA
jgi:signal transduction histidine kinase/CHASE3 domain sensor protein